MGLIRTPKPSDAMVTGTDWEWFSGLSTRGLAAAAESENTLRMQAGINVKYRVRSGACVMVRVRLWRRRSGSCKRWQHSIAQLSRELLRNA